ncbi:MAG: protein-disulfide isomerase [Nitrosopumilus sp.]|nr:protein-disulfide isomerase [Nitrosopumilus sp.]NRA05729.1 protein-disulfide isomerase [Nitrosopumilus sp.]
MGRKERRERETKRDSYATRQSAEKRKNMLIAMLVFAIVAVIVGYSIYVFLNMTETAPGGPENAGALGSAHDHAGILVNIFGDSFDFSAPAYQIKSSWIHFEGRDAFTIHKHATGVTLEYLFDSLQLVLDDQCFVFQDGRSFCTNDDYVLQLYINGEKVSDIRDYEIVEDDMILIAYGAETPEEIDGMLLDLENRELIK